MKVWVSIFCSCATQRFEAWVVRLYLKEVDFILRSETVEERILKELLAMPVVSRIVWYMQTENF